MGPLVSVLMPVFNAGEYLRPALESVLKQTYSHLEIIIIDDGSTDGCMDSIKDLTDQRLRLCYQPNAGRTSALNRGLEMLSGEFYATQDACTHAEGPLNEGDLDGIHITCPLHGSCFDVTTGMVLEGPADEPLKTYRVVITGEVGRVEEQVV